MAISSAFPPSFFDRLKAGQKVWAPCYTLHKIMAGLLDMYVLARNGQALDVVRGMAGWTKRWTDTLNDEDMARILNVEFGGMNEVLYNLYAVTGEKDFAAAAHRFDQERSFGPLAEGRDELKGLHVNTQIPKIIGAARRYELDGRRALPAHRGILLDASDPAPRVCHRRHQQRRALALGSRINWPASSVIRRRNAAAPITC